MTDLAEALIASGHEQGSSGTSSLGISIPYRVLWRIEQYLYGKERAENGGKHCLN